MSLMIFLRRKICLLLFFLRIIKKVKHIYENYLNLKSKENLIYVCPEVEPWILKSANSVGVKLSDYGLPDDLNGLEGKTKKTFNTKENPELYNTFRLLFQVLKNHNSSAVLKLSSWIEYLRDR